MTTGQEKLRALRVAILNIQEAIKDKQGYATVGECEELDACLKELEIAIQENRSNNVPF
jgi:hypothetical protein